MAAMEAPAPLRLVVETHCLRTGQMTSKKVIDHNNRDDRVWLGKHCFWAFRNAHKVTTYAESSP